MSEPVYECVRCGAIVVGGRKCSACGGKLIPYEPF